MASVELLLTLAASGRGAGLIGAGLIGAALAKIIHRGELALRPLGSRRAKVTTFLLQRKEDESSLVTRFLERAQKTIGESLTSL